MPNSPIMLTIAGSDSSAGAGLQADLKAAHAAGVYALTAATCVVAEVPGQVVSIHEIPAHIIRDQIQICLESYPIGAIKTGMLYSPAIVETTAALLRTHNACTPTPLVVDPVMIATAGTPLMQQEAIHAYNQHLFPLATLITPNIDEAHALLDGALLICSQQDAITAAQMLAARYKTAVLLKGGHLAGDNCFDVLHTPSDNKTHTWTHPRITGVSTHGTGCTLSAAIAANLAKKIDLHRAVNCALTYTHAAIKQSLTWDFPKQLQALHTI